MSSAINSVPPNKSYLFGLFSVDMWFKEPSTCHHFKFFFLVLTND